MHEDATALGCEMPDVEPRAAAYIDEMQHMIETLVTGDYAYAGNNGDVYYAVDSFADYGIYRSVILMYAGRFTC